MRGSLWRKFKMVASAEKVPFLLPALLAFAAWGLTHISDRLLKSPTLEYSCSAKPSNDGSDWSCVIRNLSDAQLYREMHLILRIPDTVGGKVEQAAIEWLGTAHHA